MFLGRGEKSHFENLTLESNTNLINNLDHGTLRLLSESNTNEINNI